MGYRQTSACVVWCLKQCGGFKASLVWDSPRRRGRCIPISNQFSTAEQQKRVGDHLYIIISLQSQSIKQLFNHLSITTDLMQIRGTQVCCVCCVKMVWWGAGSVDKTDTQISFTVDRRLILWYNHPATVHQQGRPYKLCLSDNFVVNLLDAMLDSNLLM